MSDVGPNRQRHVADPENPAICSFQVTIDALAASPCRRRAQWTTSRSSLTWPSRASRTPVRPCLPLVAPALTRHPAVRGLLHLELEPGVISLLAGKPNPTTFPITSISFKARNPLSADGLQEDDFTLTPEEVSTALQYNFVAGVPTLVNWVTKLQAFEHKHDVDPATWTVSIGSGGQDLLYKVRCACLRQCCGLCHALTAAD